MSTQAAHEVWSSQRAFLLAAIGSAVGLGNIWRFPYLAGENGGGAFVLIYILAVIAIAVPVIAAELMIGRRGRQSPVNTMRRLALDEGGSELWRYHGWLMLVIAVLASSFFSVVAGWTLAYVFKTASGAFAAAGAPESQAIFQAFLADPAAVVFWHGVFMALTVFIVSRGLLRGIERAIGLLMPALFVILIFLLIYAMVAGDFRSGLDFIFEPDFSKINPAAVLAAIGQAFVSVSVGVGVMMTYGAYLPKRFSIAKGAGIIAAADTGVALVAGLVVFSLVFAYGLAPDEGPGLIFVTLPIAFGQMPGGAAVGALFFVLLVAAALTSSIGLLEVVVSWLRETTGVRRTTLTLAAGGVIWFFGIASALSFNLWSGIKPLSGLEPFADKNIFGSIEYLTANVMTPVSVLLITVFAGWQVARRSSRDELAIANGLVYRGWRFLIRYIAPLAVIAAFVVVML